MFIEFNRHIHAKLQAMTNTLTVADLEQLPEGTIVHTADADYKRVRVVWADTNVGWRKAHRSTGRVVAGTTPVTSSRLASMGAQR